MDGKMARWVCISTVASWAGPTDVWAFFFFIYLFSIFPLKKIYLPFWYDVNICSGYLYACSYILPSFHNYCQNITCM